MPALVPLLLRAICCRRNAPLANLTPEQEADVLRLVADYRAQNATPQEPESDTDHELEVLARWERVVRRLRRLQRLRRIFAFVGHYLQEVKARGRLWASAPRRRIR